MPKSKGGGGIFLIRTLKEFYIDSLAMTRDINPTAPVPYPQQS